MTNSINNTTATAVATMVAFEIGKGKVIHHAGCGMVEAAKVSKKKLVQIPFNENHTQCKQCRHLFKREIAKATIGITSDKPVFRLVVIAPWQLEEINEDRFERLLSHKKQTHEIRIGVAADKKIHPLHLAIDSYAHENGYKLVEKVARKGQYPTELNEYLIKHADAVIAYNDDNWMVKRAIKFAQTLGKRLVVMEV